MASLASKGVSFSLETDIPSLKGKVIMVTGGNSGLGKQSIIELAKHSPSEIWLSARSEEKAQQAIEDIKAQVPNAPPIKILKMDLASFHSINAAAAKFCQQAQRLDILILNAGIMSVPEGLTTEGYEIQFGTNYIGHALLTKLLLHTMLKTAAQHSPDVRLIVVSSAAHGYAPKAQGIKFDTLKSKASQMSSLARYGQSKLADILFVQQLARMYPQIKVVAVHPGVVNTNLHDVMSNNSFFIRIAWMVAARSVAADVRTGVLNQLWASTAANVTSGEYYEPVGKAGQGKKWTDSPRLAQELWDWTEQELVGHEKDSL